MKITKQQLRSMVLEEMKKLQEGTFEADVDGQGAVDVENAVQVFCDTMTDIWQRNLADSASDERALKREIDRAVGELANELYDAIDRVGEKLVQGEYS